MSSELLEISRMARQRLMLFAKLAGILVLIGLLHIPLAMTHGVLRERQRYQAQATEEIAATWGREQVIVGPMLAVPYAYRVVTTRPRATAAPAVTPEAAELVEATAYFLPDTLAARGEVAPEVRRRGIYDVVVYTTQWGLEGEFRPDFAAAGIEAERVDWARARIYFGVSDLHGLRLLESARVGGMEVGGFESAAGTNGAVLPLVAPVRGARAGGPVEFALKAVVQGSGRLDVVPVGKATTVALRGPWRDPSFVGAALPVTRRVEATGFDAEWRSAHFSRGFPQSWTSRSAEADAIASRMNAAAFGVRFAQPVDGYAMAERAQKYGVLFFVLIFTVFFLFEATASVPIHPLQYALVGAGLCLFFLGFLALSEFWPTGPAYAVAALACTALVALYAHSFLRTGGRSLAIAGGLGGTYGYLYFVLQSQDYALIAGTAALFAALALVMFCTRRINWYGVQLGASAGPDQASRTTTHHLPS